MNAILNFRVQPVTELVRKKGKEFERFDYRSGVANLRLASHMRLFEGLFVTLYKCTRVPFSFLCYYIFKNHYRSLCVSKCLLNY